MVKPTKAQGEILTYLYYNSGQQDRIVSGGDLVEFYHKRRTERNVARYQAKDKDPPLWLTGITYPTTPTAHAYRRTGGLQLRRMAEAGLMNDCGFHRGIPQYEISADGWDWIEANVDSAG